MSSRVLTKSREAFRDLIKGMDEAFSLKRNFREIKTLKIQTKILMIVMLVATVSIIFASPDLSVMGWIGIVTSIATVMNLVLVDQGRLTNYSWGMLSCVLWLSVSIANNLIGDIFSQIFYIVMQFVGIYVWYRDIHREKTTELKAKKLSVRQGVLAFVAVIVIYAVVVAVSHFANSTQILLDGTLLPLGIIGQILMTYGYKSQWFAWIALDVVNVVIWFNQLHAGGTAAVTMFVLQIVMLLNALYGLYCWQKSANEGKTAYPVKNKQKLTTETEG